ncbi:predicted protein [Histoplasma capsulatum G186AR]|uniref:Aminotransferase class I/classII domain-containing protein n=1 Tax=Ajellomyces capsulatus (strain G186AR / H82 / ATCC MYA-2454 / RMSCC 2432) TaxID=447093 RepID=C0NXM1_AJECG|nr:uncharacterized protein HCBG_08213 [Histoplasma capsulatum G186AR]EEH04087.1 predicted protein [Histoplasma capsulatum G186AR]
MDGPQESTLRKCWMRSRWSQLGRLELQERHDVASRRSQSLVTQQARGSFDDPLAETEPTQPVVVITNKHIEDAYKALATKPKDPNAIVAPSSDESAPQRFLHENKPAYIQPQCSTPNANSPKAKRNVSTFSSLPISVQDLHLLSDNPSSSSSNNNENGIVIHEAPIQSYGLQSTPLSLENVLITPGASLANCLVFYGLYDRGDHVIFQYPTYQQLYTQPAALGADVSLWKTKGEDKWRPDIEELSVG